MKFKVTKKEMRYSGCKILGIGYCDAQYLLKGIDPDFYSAGVYGWCCDYYKISDLGVIISTGYDYIGEAVDRKLVEKYNNKARKIYCGNWDSWDKVKKQINNLLKKFIKEATKEDAEA